ncbi:hypothetical protein ACJJTC_006926 [Scirpophaga incertulas]
MKSLNIKDAIYTIAASWDELKNETLRKSWRKLWPEVMNENDQVDNDQNSDTQIIVKEVQTLDPNVTSNEIEEWITECDKDCKTYQELDDDQIVSTVLEHDALQYIEQNPSSTPMDVLWINKWRDTAAKSRISSAKQKSITDFFSK